MNSFAELAEASDEMIDNILRNVDRAVLATALQGANVRLIDRILSGRSSRTIEEVLKAIQHQQAVDMRAIESARRQVADLARELETVGIRVS